VHVLDVVGDPGDQAGHGIAGEKAQGHALDVAVQADAQIVHDPVAGQFHDQVLGKGEDENGHHHRHEKSPAMRRQTGQIRVPQLAQGGPVEAVKVFQADGARSSWISETGGVCRATAAATWDRQVNGQPLRTRMIRTPGLPVIRSRGRICRSMISLVM
jgi:hypothetical protein